MVRISFAHLAVAESMVQKPGFEFNAARASVININVQTVQRRLHRLHFSRRIGDLFVDRLLVRAAPVLRLLHAVLRQALREDDLHRRLYLRAPQHLVLGVLADVPGLVGDPPEQVLHQVVHQVHGGLLDLLPHPHRLHQLVDVPLPAARRLLILLPGQPAALSW